MKVSLIVTVYNKAPYLKRCLDSVANQTEKNFQCIIIDDGSTDGSGKICDEYAKRYKWQVFHKKRNSGVSEARNSGMSRAKGEYLAFLDADDALTDDALDVMTRITRHDMNIIQFGQYRCHGGAEIPDRIRKGFCGLNALPKRWAMVWNKIYKRDFIKGNNIKFIKGMQFGEDEIFNVEAAMANGGLYHAPQTLIKHYFDDHESLCRGELDLKRLTGLTDELERLLAKETDHAKAQFLAEKIQAHKDSKLFARFGYNKERGRKGKYDIVYFLRPGNINEELRYSLRSVEKNWQYNEVWFYGGCPDGLRPDHHVWLPQRELSKWERVRGMLIEACSNDDITEDFWLFNDDFFVLTPHNENMPPQCNKTLQDRIKQVESNHGGNETEYTARLKHLIKTLESAGKGCVDYSVHKPILINRKKALEVLEKFPDEPMFRALYGNYWEIGGVSCHDMKIGSMTFKRTKEAITTWDFVSTEDETFRSGQIGRYLRDMFSTPSRFEM